MGIDVFGFDQPILSRQITQPVRLWVQSRGNVGIGDFAPGCRAGEAAASIASCGTR